MPRKVRDANLQTRTARGRLPVRHKPFFRLIEPGLHLGYRKLTSGPGTWLVRRYVGEGRYVTENLRTADGVFVLADDFEDADGERVLSFAQAQRAVRGPKRPAAGAHTVAAAVADYLMFLEHDGRSPHSIRDARYRIEAFVLPQLGNVKLAALTADRLRHWRDEVAKAPARIRTRNGERQKHREITGEDSKRARRATANRTWTVLRAALNHAFHEGKIESDHAWRRVRPFGNVETARIRYLSVIESRRLANAADAAFRPLIMAALQTGARFSELARLEVADFDADAGTLRIRQSKSGRSRHIVLTTEGRELFAQWCTGRASGALIFTRANGQPWQKSMQARPMRAACERARIKPAISFHILRHTHGSALAMAGVPIAVIAEQLGHVGTRMTERHYSHLSPSYLADTIRRGLPAFGFRTDKRIATLTARRPANA
jgi:integrase